MVFSPAFSANAARHCLITLVFGLFALPAVAEKQVYYRYVDDQGIQVLQHWIPPEYAQRGYEIVSISGQVIKTVPPTESAEVRARKEAEAKIRKQYQRLDRRYSSLQEIESAKQRRLATLETNIAILRSNISSLETQIENLMSEAANVERAGREVPDVHLKKLADTRAELTSTEAMLESRLQDYDKTAEQFDEDMVIYAEGRELAQGQ